VCRRAQSRARGEVQPAVDDAVAQGADGEAVHHGYELVDHALGWNAVEQCGTVLADMTQQFQPARRQRRLHGLQVEEGHMRLAQVLAACGPMPCIDETSSHGAHAVRMHLNLAHDSAPRTSGHRVC